MPANLFKLPITGTETDEISGLDQQKNTMHPIFDDSLNFSAILPHYKPLASATLSSIETQETELFRAKINILFHRRIPIST